MAPGTHSAQPHDHDGHGPAAGALSLTKNQRLVLDVLERSGAPLGAYALLDALRPQGFKAPLQVYRALEKLQEAGLVHRLETLNAFLACVHPDCHASKAIAFAICEKCGSVEEFADDTVQARLADWAREHRFRPAKATVEIRGLCAACAG